MPFRLLEPAQTGDRLREITIKSDEFLIGRGADCDLRLHDTSISRHHCLLRKRGSEVSVSDLGSANGTFVNGVRVLSQTELRTGDEIRVGDCRLIVDLGDDLLWSERHFPSATDAVAGTMRLTTNDLDRKSERQ
ncbi:MAG: FHA domain-containing protein [Gemmataceae bacterium]|nr:FHA domain-containing protein [Gemmataceae bacterium]